MMLSLSRRCRYHKCESSSQYASPIVLVRKKDGSLRLTVDYRKLNKRTIKDVYALPRINDAFSRISGH